jgi:hypothetical protein
MERVDLADETLDSLASAVLTRIDYGFRYRWDPEWVGPGEPHTWAEGEQTFDRCPVCLGISPASTSVEAAISWFTDHGRTRHGS